MALLHSHAIKINRALRLSTTGKYPATAAAMMDAIPADVAAALSSARLAALIDAMDRLAAASKALACRDACDEGTIWDARAQKLREIDQ